MNKLRITLIFSIVVFTLVGVLFIAQDVRSAGPRVLYIGDSFIQRWPTPDSITNAGYGGYTCGDILNKFRNLYQGQHFDTIVLWCGTNDVGAGLSDDYYHDTIRQMIWDFGASHPQQVILMNMTPPGPQSVTGKPPARVITENEWLKNLTQTWSLPFKLIYVDAYSAVTGQDGLLPHNLTDDDTHLNNAGYAIVEQLLKDQNLAVFQ
jgi:lysophospholipase L1-like esterase